MLIAHMVDIYSFFGLICQFFANEILREWDFYEELEPK